jgi:hypothetical protein
MAKQKIKKPTFIKTSDALKKLEAIEKKRATLHAAISKGKARLDASQNALRVVEQAVGGKLVAKPNRP